MLSPLRLDIDPLVLGSPWLISEELVKGHARIDTADDDALLQLYLKAAIGWAESATQRVIYSRDCRWVLKDFPCDGPIRLPCGKASAVSLISYVSGGQAGTLTGPTSGSPAGADFQEDLRSDSGGVLMPPLGGTWPSADWDAVSPVTITFTAGWSAAAVPAELQHAILFALEDLYDQRGSMDIDPSLLGNAGARLAARNTLIDGWRLARVY